MSSAAWRVFGVWRVVVGFLQNFFHPRVHERIFEKTLHSPPQKPNPPHTGEEESLVRAVRTAQDSRTLSKTRDLTSKAGPRVVMGPRSRTGRPEKVVNTSQQESTES